MGSRTPGTGGFRSPGSPARNSAPAELLHAAEVEECRELLRLLGRGDHDHGVAPADQGNEAEAAAAGVLERAGGDLPRPALQTLGPGSGREDLLDVAAEQCGIPPRASP